MIAKKIFEADGSNFRFLSDFIIRGEQFARVYNYIYDADGIEGSVDPASGLYIRTSQLPHSDDLVTIDKWDLVDNSISFYTIPYTGSMIYIEVATTSEEFGDTMVQPSVEKAEDAAIAAATSASEAAISASESAGYANTSLTHSNKAYQWAEEAEDVAVEPGEYSAHHWATKAITHGVSEATFPAQEGFVWTAESTGNKWRENTSGAVEDLFYENAQNVSADYTVLGNRNAMTAGPIEIDDGIVVSVEDGATWTVV